MDKKIMVLVIAFILNSCGTSSMTVDVQGLDDPLEEKIKVTSVDYSQPFILTVGQADYFFRAYIYKKTKNRVFQLYVSFNSSDWVYWDRVKFNTDEGLKILELTSVGRDVDCSNFGCAHYEDVVFEIERLWLDDWSSKPTTLRFYSTKVSTSLDIEIFPEEAKAFAQKLDEIKL